MADSKTGHKNGELEKYFDENKEVDHVDASPDQGLPGNGRLAPGRHQPKSARQYSASGRRLSEWDGVFPMAVAYPS
jgi:hypothetical protein